MRCYYCGRCEDDPSIVPCGRLVSLFGCDGRTCENLEVLGMKVRWFSSFKMRKYTMNNIAIVK